MINEQIKWLFSVLLCGFLLMGCDFKQSPPLRFPHQLQPLNVDIKEPYGVLSKKLQTQLRAAHINYTLDPATNHYVLQLEETMLPDKVLTIATTTRIRQNQLTFQLQYSVLAPTGETLVPAHAIEITRTHYQNLDNLLGTHHDREQLEDEMKAEALTAMIYQLQAQQNQQAILQYQRPDYYAD